MTGSIPSRLEEYKIQASILLKHLNSADTEKALSAATRFQRLSQLQDHSPQEIFLRREGIQRKHALAVIALENRQPSWADLKHLAEKRDAIREKRDFTELYPLRCDGFLNEWYANYQIAREHLDAAGGYLLPYRHHFFICKKDYINALGLDPEDPDWARIGFDWVRPADREAWQRLNSRLPGNK